MCIECGMLVNCKYKNMGVNELWSNLGDIPVDNDNCIDIDWYLFDKGTHTDDIWLWFEDTFDVSVADDLMGLTNYGVL